MVMICMPLNTTQELIEDIAAGKMVIIMDDEDRKMRETSLLLHSTAPLSM